MLRYMTAQIACTTSKHTWEGFNITSNCSDLGKQHSNFEIIIPESGFNEW